MFRHNLGTPGTIIEIIAINPFLMFNFFGLIIKINIDTLIVRSSINRHR